MSTEVARSSILLVEDDPEMRDRILAPAFREAGYDVHIAGSAIEMYRQLLAHAYQVILLDVGPPDEDGFTAVRHVRSSSAAGVVMLTGRGSAADRVRGLDHGADAYLCKPVELDVLLATVRSVIRRLEPSGEPANDVGPAGWRLDAGGWALAAPDGRTVPLSQGERILLQALFANAGEAVPREQLLRELAQDDHEFDPHRLEMLVYRLRRKVQTACGTALPVSSVRGVGYVLVTK